MNRPAKEVSRAEYANLITRFAGRIFHRVDTIKEKGKEVRYRYFVKSAGSKQVTRAIGHVITMNHKPYRTRKELEKEKADALSNSHGAEYSRIMLYCLKFIENKDLDSDEVKAQLKSSETRWVDYAVRNKMTKTQREMFHLEIEKIITECKAEINRKLMRKSD